MPAEVIEKTVETAPAVTTLNDKAANAQPAAPSVKTEAKATPPGEASPKVETVDDKTSKHVPYERFSTVVNENKQLRAEIEKARKSANETLAAKPEVKAVPGMSKEDQEAFWEDPGKFIRAQAESIATEKLTSFQQQQAAHAEVSDLWNSEEAKADPLFKDHIKDIWKAYPNLDNLGMGKVTMLVYREAYKAWKAEQPEATDKAPAEEVTPDPTRIDKAAATSLGAGSTAAGKGKVWYAEDIGNMPAAEFKAHEAEIDKAYAEGRVKRRNKA